MKLINTALVAIAGAAIVALAACSDASRNSNLGLPQSATPSQRAHSAGAPLLYVADYAKDTIDIFQRISHRWTNVGQIKESVLDPLSVWVDTSDNLYVANGLGPVNEYDSSGKLIFSYESAGSARNVTTDREGNVYTAGTEVSEYPQGSDQAYSCESPAGRPGSVAVDKDGDVFVGTTDKRGVRGRIVEYVHGLLQSQCKGTRLPFGLPSVPYGLAIDQEGNLLATAPNRGAGDIDVIAPPYTSITSIINARGPWPVSLRINKANTEIYVADSSTYEVNVIAYPGGASKSALGDDEGLTQPVSAVSSANYIP